uniref:BTB domain-containing protein n=1 Tax=Panagrolaimus davidi TaxID=227884 RepID=A0A914PX09_9BILA
MPVRIQIKEFDTEIVKAALEFCYEKYDNFIGNETKLFEFAIAFEIENLKKACLAYFGENITPENVCEIVQIAYSHNFQSL